MEGVKRYNLAAIRVTRRQSEQSFSTFNCQRTYECPDRQREATEYGLWQYSGSAASAISSQRIRTFSATKWIAARLEGLADPGGICVSARVKEDVYGKLDAAFDDIGEQQLKNIAKPIRAYRLRPKSTPVARANDAAASR